MSLLAEHVSTSGSQVWERQSAPRLVEGTLPLQNASNVTRSFTHIVSRDTCIGACPIQQIFPHDVHSKELLNILRMSEFRKKGGAFSKKTQTEKLKTKHAPTGSKQQDTRLLFFLRISQNIQKKSVWDENTTPGANVRFPGDSTINFKIY